MSANPKGQSRNKANQDQSDELKRRARRRLIGSIVLFLTAVIVVPAIIENNPAQKASPIELVVPSRQPVSIPSPSEVIPPEASGIAVKADSAGLTNIPQAETVKPAASNGKPSSVSTVGKGGPEPKVAEKPVVKKTEKPAVTEVKKSAPVPPVSDPVPVIPPKVEPQSPVGADPIERFAQADVYWVQVAALKDQERAQGLRDKLRGAGFEGRIESISTDAGKVYRVRVGPLAGQTNANDVQSRLKKLGYTGRVVQ